jgi:DNA-binding Xre family transcriptional regulator
MAISWRLKTFLSSQRNIRTAIELQKRVAKKTGILISVQNLCLLMNKKPCSLKLKTMELICTALECNLSDFCEIKPAEIKSSKSAVKKLSYQNTPFAKRAQKRFPEPKDYK